MREPPAAPRDAAPRETAGVGDLHPDLIRVARACYQTYLDDLDRTGQPSARPLGVAVDRVSHRATAIVDPKQPLLPQEHFIPLHLIAPNEPRSASRP